LINLCELKLCPPTAKINDLLDPIMAAQPHFFSIARGAADPPCNPF
jgi:hypothetical protein